MTKNLNKTLKLLSLMLTLKNVSDYLFITFDILYSIPYDFPSVYDKYKFIYSYYGEPIY